jgi:hypothetical protein
VDEFRGTQENSRKAAERIAPTKPTRQQEVYDFIASRGVRGATDNEIIAEMVSRGISANGPRARRGELLDAGLIREAIGVGPRDGSTVWFTNDQAMAREGLVREAPLFPDTGGPQ